MTGALDGGWIADMLNRTPDDDFTRYLEIAHRPPSIEILPDDAWLPISTAPQDEIEPFLVLLPANSAAKYVILQVTRFEGQLYPDHMDGNIDRSDAVTTATHWKPCGKLPKGTS